MKTCRTMLGLVALFMGGAWTLPAQVEPRPLANAALTLRQAPPVVLFRCYEWWTGKKVTVPKEFESLTKPLAVSFEGLTPAQAAERVAEILKTQVGIELVAGPNGTMLARRIGAGIAGPSADRSGRGLEFIGFLTTSDARLFTLRELESGLVSPWLKLGQAWRGHTLQAYDPAAEKLTLTRAGVPLELALAARKPDDPPLGNAGNRSLDPLLNTPARSIRDLPTQEAKR
jgi:hypothetical protein